MICFLPPVHVCRCSLEGVGGHVAVGCAMQTAADHVEEPSVVPSCPRRFSSCVRSMTSPFRDRPELANKPVAVGGESMISTTNYHARLKGVRSAMPGFIGRKLCPELVFVKPDYDK